MGKRLKIELRSEVGTVRISEDEYPNLMLDHKVTKEELNKAIDTIITHFAQKEVFSMIVYLKRRNDLYGPAREMTIEEIETELGCKIKIVKEKDDGNR